MLKFLVIGHIISQPGLTTQISFEEFSLIWWVGGNLTYIWILIYFLPHENYVYSVQTTTTCLPNNLTSWFKMLLHQGPVHMGSHVSKPQHEGKAPTFGPRKTIDLWFYNHWSHISIFLCNNFAGLMFGISSNFLLDPTLNTSFQPCLQKMLPCNYSCHTSYARLGTYVKW